MRKLILMMAVVGFVCGALGAGAPATGASTRLGQAFAIKAWTTDEGLPQNTVTTIQQTRDGYLWFGTLNGLVRFDGLRFEVFDESNTPNLESSRIVKVYEDRASRLWIGTENAGMVLMTNGHFASLGIGQGGFEKRVMSLAEDAQDALWLMTANGEVWRHRAGQWNAFLPFPGRPSNCRAIIAEPQGPLWLGTDWQQSSLGANLSSATLSLPLEPLAGISRLDFLAPGRRSGYWRLADGHVQKCRGREMIADWGSYPWGGERVMAACEDLDGGLVVGTLGGGIYWLKDAGQVAHLSSRDGLSSDFVLSVCLDREGTLWVGTDGGGLNQVKREVFTTLPLPAGIASRAVQSVCADAQGGLWMGINNGGAVYWRAGQSRRYDISQGLLNPYVWSVYCDRSNRVWAGTWGGGLFQLQNDRFAPVAIPFAGHREIRVIFEDRAGNFWLGTQGGLLRRDERGWKAFGPDEGFPVSAVQAIAEDPDGSIWIGTARAGLYQYRQGAFTAYRKSGPLPSDDITALLVDHEGALWIGTAGSGLVRRQRGQWKRYTVREGLASNSINYLIEDEEQCLWVGSNAGLTRVAHGSLSARPDGPLALEARSFAKPDGLPTRECTLGSQPAAALTSDGRLWFPTIKGVATIDPALLNTNQVAPPVRIETLLVEGQPWELPPNGEPIVIPPGRERLEIHYTSLNLSAPDRARFRYQMSGFEQAWTEAGNSRVARYPKLPPGEFHFRVTACNEDGVWNEQGASIALKVLPPFWRTWWFIGMAILGAMGGIAGTVYSLSAKKLRRHLRFTRQKEALEKERARIARDLHDQLGASLTQIALLGELAESDKDLPDEVELHARQITQTSREITRVLDEIVWAVNPSNDTLDSLVTYICKYAQDYFSLAGVRYRIEVPPSLPAIALAPDARHNLYLAAKEAIANVVRHAQATEAHLRLRLHPDHFCLEIEDNGRGAPTAEQQASSARNGLRNMRKRMEDVGGSFTIEPAPVKGALVRLTAPLGRVASTASPTIL